MEEKDLSSLLGHLGELGIIGDRVYIRFYLNEKMMSEILIPDLDKKKGRITDRDILTSLKEGNFLLETFPGNSPYYWSDNATGSFLSDGLSERVPGFHSVKGLLRTIVEEMSGSIPFPTYKGSYFKAELFLDKSEKCCEIKIV